MTTAESATKILDSLLGHLGYAAKIDLQATPDGPCLQIQSADSAFLIGKDGERLDDLQYLVNRILRRRRPDAERIKVDCGHFRAIQEDHLNEEIKAAAERVKITGKPFQFRPLNAYYRRIVHNCLVADSQIVSHSPPGDDRLKRITISLKNAPASTSPS
jgi:spoIIIJ-associated protein